MAAWSCPTCGCGEIPEAAKALRGEWEALTSRERIVARSLISAWNLYGDPGGEWQGVNDFWDALHALLPALRTEFFLGEAERACAFLPIYRKE